MKLQISSVQLAVVAASEALLELGPLLEEEKSNGVDESFERLKAKWLSTGRDEKEIDIDDDEEAALVKGWDDLKAIC